MQEVFWSEKQKGTDDPFLFLGRGDKIRTCDFYVPKTKSLVK